jgi:hypothetical protein
LSPRFQHGFEGVVQELDAGTKDEEEEEEQQQQQFFCCFVQKNIGLEEEVTTASLLASTHFCICVPTLYTPHCTDQCRRTDRVYIWGPAHSMWSSNLQRSILCVPLSSLMLLTAGTRSSETTSRKRRTTTPSLLPVMQS